MSLLTIILNILLPPLAVFLSHGLSSAFWINLILTLIGWIPGVIHAFYVNSTSGGTTSGTRV
ncbi:MAG: YqaE/Pmp3 family membrane protein [Candidatus Cyclobacteriaceae bacterium M2_1C_046]